MAKPAVVGVLLLVIAAPVYAQSIAQNYPGDQNIETDPDVIFVERFEDTIADLLGRWTEVGDQTMLSLVADVPPGSPGTRSLRMGSDGVANGSSLYKMVGPGIDDRLHLRYYAKYPTGTPGGSGRMGGYNPATPWPQGNLAGRPTGSDVFFAWASAYGPSLEMLLQGGWMGMHADGAGGYWANQFVNPSTTTLLPAGAWTCVELMIRLNNPVTSLNGELALWINGNPVNSLALGVPNGSWASATFTTDAAGTPFEGFQWRNDAALNINWFQLLHYLPGTTGNTQFDHVVVGRSYIGPLLVAAPVAPTGLTAVAGDTQVTLTWNASPGATSYQIRRSLVSGGSYTTVATVTGTSASNAGLTNGTTYYYVVVAVNSGGSSPPSNEVAATPAPAPPKASPKHSRCGCSSIAPGAGWVPALLAAAVLLLLVPSTRGPARRAGGTPPRS